MSGSVGVTVSCIHRWENGDRLPRNNDAALRYLAILEDLEQS
jgi:DNA-binding transcriptional regulator YiaG